MAEIETIGGRLAESHPGSNPEFGLAVSSLHDATVGDVRSPLLILQGAVALVLLIGCANVTNLLLARGAERSGELAVRTALGARRGRLARQLLTESLTLGVIGGIVGLLLVYGGNRFLAAAPPPDLVRVDEVRIDGTVALFTAALILIVSIGSGTLPALRTSRWGMVGRLEQAGRGGSADHGGSRLRALLVVVQTATAVVLLAGAGLLVRSFIELQGVDRGFRSDGALVFDLASRSVEEPVTFYSRVIERLEALPGVQDVGGIQGLPLTGFGFGSTFTVDGREPPGPGERPSVQIRIATPGLFRAMGIPVVRGRGFTPQDREGAPQVALISESAARRYFPGEDPIGQSVRLPWVRGGRRVGSFEIVGVMRDVRAIDLADAPTAILYLPFAQVEPFAMSIVLRTSVPPLSIAGAVRDAVREINANVPVDNMRRLDQVVSESVSRPRFYTSVLSIFAAMAMILAATGIYAVMSYTVTQRTREIGLRLALGAQPAGLLRSVVRRGLKLTLVGLAAGIVGALALTRLLRGLLFNVEATDLATYLAVAAVLGVIAFVASYMPARSAARLDPMVALRAE